VKDLDTREWLLTNGLGGFASGTVCDVRTRSYHGWLVAALEPPGQRTLLLSHIDASLEVAGQTWAISTNFWDGGRKIEPLGYQLLSSFAVEPIPRWIWSHNQHWQLTRRLVMPYGLEGSRDCGEWAIGNGEWRVANPIFQFCNRILIQYRYEGSKVATLRLRPLIADRDLHRQQSADEDLKFSQLVEPTQISLQGIRAGQVGSLWQLRWSAGSYRPEGVWYWNYYYPEEHTSGFGSREDLYSPGYLTVLMHPGDSITLEARVGMPEAVLLKLNTHSFEQAVRTEQERQNQLFALGSVPCKIEQQKIWHQLLQAGEQFIAYRASIAGPTVLAGFPGLSDWGRDTLIALPGLALATGRWSLAKGLLKTFGSYCVNGLIPNTFPDAGARPVYNSIDASLWWIETLGLYLEATQDWDFLIEQYSVVRRIYKAYTAGTIYNIQVDASDGLMIWDTPGVALTWMDVVIDGKPVTPRRGKPVEINALWYSALCWISKWTEKMVVGAIADRVRLLHHAQHYMQQADKVKASLQKYWNPERNYFYDTIEPDDRRNAQIRPNAVLALSLYHCGFPQKQARLVLRVARDRLLTPYGLRSLDPADPNYIGHYSSNQWYREKASHQGCVWGWLIGPFIRAWQRFYPTQPIPFDWQPLLDHFQQEACIGSISEIFDGDPPHSPRGAIAQAWSVAELIRHFSDF